ncbi:MAG: twin-arginine translocase subunit TatB [Clostridia bacterium]|nr:twin-arginine translocase subunit TatB [Clostridia bacterium]
MFNIGFAELLLILVIAYVIVGPKDLPKVARWLARLVKSARRMIRELKAEVGWDDMMRETEDVRTDIDQTLKEADVTADLRDARKELNKSIGEAKKETFKKN